MGPASMLDPLAAGLELDALAQELEDARRGLRAQREALQSLPGQGIVGSPPLSPSGLAGLESLLQARDDQIVALEEQMAEYLEQARRAVLEQRRDARLLLELRRERESLLEMLAAEQDRALATAETIRADQQRRHLLEQELDSLRLQQSERAARQDELETARREGLAELELARQMLVGERAEAALRDQRLQSMERWLEQERERCSDLEARLRSLQHKEAETADHGRALELTVARLELERDNAVHDAARRASAAAHASHELERLQSEQAELKRARERELAELRQENLRLRNDSLRLGELQEEARLALARRDEMETELSRHRAQVTDLSERLAEAVLHEPEAYRLRLELEKAQARLAESEA